MSVPILTLRLVYFVHFNFVNCILILYFPPVLGLYSCQLTPLPIVDQELSLFQAKVVIQVSAVNVFNEHRDITFIPSVYINMKELFIGQFSGKDKLIIVGLPLVLSQIEVSICSSPTTYFKITL